MNSDDENASVPMANQTTEWCDVGRWGEGAGRARRKERTALDTLHALRFVLCCVVLFGVRSLCCLCCAAFTPSLPPSMLHRSPEVPALPVVRKKAGHRTPHAGAHKKKRQVWVSWVVAGLSIFDRK